MGTDQKKEFSVVVNLDKFDGLNGELSHYENEEQRQNYVEQFFLKRYGDGGGKLEIEQKQTKIRLKWLQPNFDLNAEISHKEGLAFAKNKNYKEAINRWVRAISLNPSDPDYYFNLGIAFFEIKNYKESIENLSRALDLCPIYYKAHLILGTVYLKIRKFDQAEAHLKESIIFYPNHELAYLNLGAVYSILKRYEEGIKMFLKTIELSPREVRAHFGLAKIYSINGVVEKANQHFKNVIEINTNQQLTNLAKRAMIAPLGEQVQSSERIDSANIERYYQEGYNAFLFSDYDKAMQMYKIYLQKKSDDDSVWYSLGEASLRAGHVSKAVEFFKKAISLNPGKGLYYKELAIAFNYMNKEQEALACLKKAKQLGKIDSISFTIWGKILIQQGNNAEAIEKLQQALKLNSNNLLTKYNIAIAATKNNNRDIAINCLHEIINSPMNSPIKMEAETLLGTLKPY